MLIITDVEKILDTDFSYIKKFGEKDIVCCFNLGGQSVDISFVNRIRACKAQVVMIPEANNSLIVAYLCGLYSNRGAGFIRMDIDCSDVTRKIHEITELMRDCITDSDEKPEESKPAKKNLFGGASELIKKVHKKEPEEKIIENGQNVSEVIIEINEGSTASTDVREEKTQKNAAENGISESFNSNETSDDFGFDGDFRPFEEISETLEGQRFAPSDELEKMIYDACTASNDPEIKGLLDSNNNIMNIKSIVKEASDDMLGIQIMLGMKFEKRMAGKLTPFVKELYNKARNR